MLETSGTLGKSIAQCLRRFKFMDSMDTYIKTYSDIDFERKGLFELLRSMFPKSKVIYPGCSSHITPSFFLSACCLY